MRHRATILLVLAVLVSLLDTADAGKVKVYRYRTADGAIDVGTEVPEGATVLETVGEVDSDEPLRLPDLDLDSGALGERARTDIDRTVQGVLERPLEAAALTVALLVWAWLLLLLYPPVFKTLELGPRQAFNMLMAILVGVSAIAFVDWSLEFLWPHIRWRPSDSFGERPLDIIVGTLCALVAVYVFRKRLGVSIGAATIFAALWGVLVAATGVVAWLYLVPMLRG